MKGALALMILSLALAACETPSTEAGSADYDALRRASADCSAQGGKLVLKDQGDPERINAYVCKRT